MSHISCTAPALLQLPSDVIIHHIIPYLVSTREPYPHYIFNLMRVHSQTLNRMIRNDLTEITLSGGHDLYGHGCQAIKYQTFSKFNVKPELRYTQQLHFSNPKKPMTRKLAQVLECFPNLTRITFHGLYFKENSDEKQSNGSSSQVLLSQNILKLTKLRTIEFIECKGSFENIFKGVSHQLKTLIFENCIGSLFKLKMSEMTQDKMMGDDQDKMKQTNSVFKNITTFKYITKYMDGQHKKYKSKLITKLPQLFPNLTSLTLIDTCIKGFAPATPCYYALTKLDKLKELNIDSRTIQVKRSSRLYKN
ncbi:hypothetical protein C9374_004265 [Naegleria lovaniensis]|uniref:Uncharacterized protein n=1 Tax=Naegleria lovaniensis TaxID=51637 RepID=A0AA88GM92_NAELO|nr:uncharacterized protein C9374_004265 [Naegleria lovaniensis]KAG2383594.1 hypothetical protein C9374_004265 [Naegleria lovaniensis]